MRKFTYLFGLIVFLAVSQSWALEGSFGLQGGLVAASLANGKALYPDLGVNGFAFFDFKLLPGISLGIGTSFSSLSDNERRIYLDGTHLLGRISTFAESSWTPYLLAGLGFRPFYDLDPDHRWWKGDFQATAGIGVRHPLFRGIDLDMTAFYDINGPSGNLLNSFGARAGLAFPFGDDNQDKAQAKNFNSSHPKTDYEVHKGDSLWAIGRKVTGTGNSWKNLYDANKESIQDPNLIYPRQNIVVPGTTAKSTKENNDSKD